MWDCTSYTNPQLDGDSVSCPHLCIEVMSVETQHGRDQIVDLDNVVKILMNSQHDKWCGIGKGDLASLYWAMPSSKFNPLFQLVSTDDKGQAFRGSEH